MSRVITFILSAVVLMHAVFGCCVHHAHSCETDCCDAPAVLAATCGCHGHDEYRDMVPVDMVQASVTDGLPWQEARAPRPGGHQCEGSECSLELTVISRDSVTAESLAVATVPARATADLLRAERIVVRSWGNFAAAPSGLRRHLSLSILLI